MTAGPDASGVPLRRHFVAVVSPRYDDPHLPALPGVDKELSVLRTWLCSPDLDPRRRFTPAHTGLAQGPSTEQVRQALITHLSWTDGDAGVVFVTGHGVKAHGRHWLAFRDTDLGRMFGTAVETSHLVGSVADQPANDILIIVDTCFSGAAGAGTLAFDAPIPERCLVLASAGGDQIADVGALTDVIDEILTELRADTPSVFGDEPYLREDQFFTTVNELLKERGQHLVPLGHRLLAARAHRCLPNPRYRPDAATVDPRRRDLAIRAEDMTGHWDPRSRGVTSGGEPGWLFTGRADLMRLLIAATTAAAGTTVVTGRAGCGKSAALARLVTLSDPRFLEARAEQVSAIPPDLRPAVNAVDVAVLATGKLAADILGQILTALDIPVTATAGVVATLADLQTAWTAWQHRTTATVTIVVDAVDEATNPRNLIDDVLALLVTGRRVRLIVGVRAPSPDEPTPTPTTAALSDLITERLSANRLQIDQLPLWSINDLADYIAQTLTQPDTSPYRTLDPDTLTHVAGRIAADAQSSFLIARLASGQLAARPDLVDVESPQWQTAIRAGVVGMFGADLRTSLTPEDRERAVDLLRAVAFAYGRGLPWYQIWPRVANAVSLHDKAYGDNDIAWLLGSRLGGYLVTDTEDDTTVYRLFHDELRTALREHAPELLHDPT